MTATPVAFFARQAGAANALALVAQRCAGAQVFAEGTAITCFEQLGVSLSRDRDVTRPQVLVTGTSLDVAGDRAWWRWGAERGATTVAWVDSWVNYGERFGGEFGPPPDVIAVIDELARGRMIEAGAPSDRVVAVGHPSLDAAASARQPPRVADGTRRVLFIGEPLSEVGTAAARFGFDEHTGSDLLVEALALVDCPVEVVVRRHPREAAAKYAPLVSRLQALTGVTARAAPGGDRLEAVAAADVVVGMTSMMLREASLAGRPVVSLQPGRRGPTDVVDGDPTIAIVSGPVEAAVALRERSPSVVTETRRSTDRFVALLDRVAPRS